MHIALTYDLRADYLADGLTPEETAEFDSPETIAALEDTLAALGHVVTRVGNIKALVRALAAGERWDLVFNIAEGLHGTGREAQVPALLDAYRIPYTFSGPLVMALTLDKAVTKRVVRDAGLATAPFAVAATVADLADIALPYPLFVKPNAEGSSKGVTARSRVETPADLRVACEALWQQFRQPVLIETYLPGRELTVGLLGAGATTQVIGVAEVDFRPHSETTGRTFANKQTHEAASDYRLATGKLADAAADLAVRVWQILGCLDAGRVDIRCDAAGIPQFIEVNPLSGLRPGYSDLPVLAAQAGMTYENLIAGIVSAALQRSRQGI